uniref:Carboxysome shell protein CcmK n=1 Tax=Cyanothece sp. (strain PCC 7425 / ATCC 29141) TaxID=395961 RepID=B8HX53_CYAP4
MTLALGMVELLGVPAALAVADVMVKAAAVTFVGYENTDLGRITVIVRGAVAEVQIAVAAGVASGQRVQGGQVLAFHVIPQPQINLEAILPIGSSAADSFLTEIRFPPPLSP